jgi:hypothetical protein
MRGFIFNLKQAILGGNYLKDFENKSFWRATGYISILVALHFIIVFTVPFLGSLIGFSVALNKENVQIIIDKYIPEGVEIVVKDGKVSVVDELPVIIPFSSEFIENSKNQTVRKAPIVENLLVIDPSVESTLESFQKYKTGTLVTHDQIFVMESNGLKVIKIPEKANFVVNQNNIHSSFEKIRPFIIVGLFIFPILILIFGTLINMIAIWVGSLFYALAILIVASVKKIKLNYQKSYIITLYSLTLPIIMNIISNTFFGINLNFIVYIVLVFILAIINLKKEKVEQVGSIK